MMNKSQIILSVFFLITGSILNGQDRYSVKKAPYSTDRYDEFSPVIVGDRIIFCSNMENELFITFTGKNNKGLFNIFSVNNTDSAENTTPEIFSHSLMTPFNDGPASFDTIGSFIAYSRNIDIKTRTKNIFDPNNNLGIYFATKRDGDWTDIEPFIYNDSTYSNTTPWLSPDGKYLYFASNMPGGYGGSDIYRSERIENGWGKPENLGNQINSKGNEVYPFITLDGTLFFSSDGHPGIGNKDIYMTHEIDGGWLDLIHLDTPINSKEDDFSLITNSDFSEGYFSSNRLKSDDIFSFKTIVSQLYNCDTLKENNYCFTFWDDKFPGLDSLPVIYEWEFSDGDKIRGLQVEHCFQGAGKYWASLNIIDNSTSNTFFTQSSMEFELTDFEQPFITSRDAYIFKDDMEFSGLASNLPNCIIEDYIWEFGDGYFTTGSEVTHKFNKAGVYNVKLGIRAFNEVNNSKETRCVFKPVTIVPDNQALAMLLSGIKPPVTNELEVAKRETNSIDQDFSVFDINPDEEVFRVEVLSSDKRIMVTDTIFDPLRETYEIKEYYILSDSLYSYTVGENNSLISSYDVYNDVVRKGFTSAMVKTYVLAELPTEIVAKINRDFAEMTDANFEFNQSEVSENSYEILDRVAKILEKNPDLAMEIAAHTDNIGSFEFNMTLSQKRAVSIVNYLVSKGIEKQRLIGKGYGESRPISTNGTEEGRMKNRRVEFIILNKQNNDI